jgi:riboflavin synthase
MFTGIVEALGTVHAVEETERGRRLTIETSLEDLDIGDSVSVNGVCLTVTHQTGAGLEVDVVEETLLRTDLGALAPGDRVDLERSMPATGRFDGHIVQGHVDGTGTVAGIEIEGESVRMRVTLPPRIARYVAEKGSIAVDGVSLTITAVGADWFEVALIPHTLDVTVLGLRTHGDTVNLEVDVIAKYLERLLEETR